jgi:hypothetical protein
MKVKPQIQRDKIENLYYLYEIRLFLTASIDPQFKSLILILLVCKENEVYL